MKEEITAKLTLDNASKFIGLIAAMFVIVAGSLFSFYFLSINYFPKIFGTDYTLIFFAVPVVFGLIVCVVNISLLSLGLGLRPIWHGLQTAVRRVMVKFDVTKSYVDNNEEFTIAKAEWYHVVFIILGLVILVGFGSQGVKPFLLLITCCFGGALFWSQFLVNQEDISTLKSKKELSKKKRARLVGLQKHQKILIVGIAFIPLLFGGITTNLITATMTFTNVRTSNATVHVKKPYMGLLESTGMIGTQSFLGSESLLSR